MMQADRFSTRDPNLPGQFLLTSRATRTPPGYSIYEYDGWTLKTDLPTSEILGADGSCIGWIIGWAVTPQGKLITGLTRLRNEPTVSTIEGFLYQHGGRFAAIILASCCKRLYLDPAGSLAAVYRSSTQAPADAAYAASSTSLLAWADGRDPVRLEPGVNRFWPAGLTADPHARRLLPNHYLDLSTAQPVRHHLKRTPERRSSSDVESLVSDILRHITLNVTGAVDGSDLPPALTLTAGRDSRMILAASRPLAHRLDLITFDYPYDPRNPSGTNADRLTAHAVASRVNLSHRVLPIRPLDPSLQAEYLFRIGYAGHSGKSRDFLQACRERLPAHQPLLTGFGGEVGRAFYWTRLAHNPGKASAKVLLRRLRLIADEPAIAAMQSWLDSFEWEDLESLLDMVYLEQRLGCWAGPHTYGFANVFNMSPFTHRRVFDAMLGLPVEYRRAQRLADDVVRLGWPALADIPFNDRKKGLLRKVLQLRSLGSLKLALRR